MFHCQIWDGLCFFLTCTTMCGFSQSGDIVYNFNCCMVHDARVYPLGVASLWFDYTHYCFWETLLFNFTRYGIENVKRTTAYKSKAFRYIVFKIHPLVVQLFILLNSLKMLNWLHFLLRMYYCYTKYSIVLKFAK